MRIINTPKEKHISSSGETVSALFHFQLLTRMKMTAIHYAKRIIETRRFVLGLFTLLFSLLFSLPAVADTVTFDILDRTGLTSGTYSVSVLGISTAGGSDGNGVYLDSDGTWQDISSLPSGVINQGSGKIPCWELSTDITQMVLDNSQTALSGRVYFMIATDNSTSVCETYTGSGTYKGFSGTTENGGVFTFTDNGTKYTAPKPSQVIAGVFPAWVFVEVGGSATAATIDASQVDFISFPINALAYPSVNQPNDPSYLTGVGNSFDTDSSEKGFSNMAAVKLSFETQFADADQRYLQLMTILPGSQGQYILQNPGGYLGLGSHNSPDPGYCEITGFKTATSFNCDFLNLVENYLWSTNIETTGEPWTGSLNSGGAFGSVEQDTFAGTTVQIPYPGITPSHMVNAIKFTGQSTGYVAYVFSPKDIESMCQMSPNPMPAADVPDLCGSNPSVGYQIYAGAGALGTPPWSKDMENNHVTNMISNPKIYGLKTGTVVSEYQKVAARMGFLISTAFNRGVAGLKECKYNGNPQKIGDCWQDESLWYPTEDSVQKGQYFTQTDGETPDLSQNKFALWLHTARDTNGDYLFAQPVSPQSWTGDESVHFSMGYGFSNDENPTPNPPYTGSDKNPLQGSQTQPQTPSKWDGNVPYVDNGNSYIVIGPWQSGKINASPNAGVDPPPAPQATCANVAVSSLYPYYKFHIPPVSLVCDSGTSVTGFSAPNQTQSNYQWTCNNGGNTSACSSDQVPADHQWPVCASPPPLNSTLTTTQPPDSTLCQNGTAASYQYLKGSPPSKWRCSTSPLINGTSTPKDTSCQAAQ